MTAGQVSGPPFLVSQPAEKSVTDTVASAQDPRRSPVLSDLKAEAHRLIASGKLVTAVAVLRTATTLAPSDLSLWLNLAGVQRASGDIPSALASVDAALVIDPKAFLALLMKGSLLERSGQVRAAAVQYGRALAQAPPGARIDAATDAALHHARQVCERHRAELGRYIRADLGSCLTAANGLEKRRIDQFIDATLGIRRTYHQQPTDFCYPGLPAIEFHERTDFPWLGDLEAETVNIRSELSGMIEETAEFSPYINYPDGVPLDQWADLNRSPRWSACHLLYQGRRQEEHAARCPKTMSVLAELPQPYAQGRMPAAMFSLLRPRTRIPPHTGVANVRLVVHLPLIVPAGCGFRVGNETREWREAEAWVFDDTIEHEAWNDSHRDRYVLIFDIWNPRLSAAEREMISAVMAAMDRYQGTSAESSL
ncbi:MAG: aspartyl beta-hydroxylase [Xanthomonadaceae bacterium]|nr:aspartyl beta-hydroxylase [Xanthomonadaceae bacterium]